MSTTVEPTMSGRQRSLARIVARREAFVSAVFLIVLVLVAATASWLVPHDPNRQDLGAVLSGPNGDHWFGTDSLGRDMFSRLLVASRVALLAAAEAVGLALLIGVPLGLVVGYRGGWWDRLLMRFVDAIIALPGIVVAVAILAVLGSGLTNAMLAIGIVFGMTFLRLTRATTLAVREELFVDASKVIGTRERTIIFGHILPNVAPPLLVQTTLAFGTALLVEAGLSFLGLGVQPPQASWGSMLADTAPHIRRNWFIAIPPGVLIALTVLAFNLLGDAIRDSIGRGTQPAPLRRAKFTVAEGASTDAVGAMATASDGTAEESSATQPVLDVDQLHVAFIGPRGENIPVVSGVSFHVEPGETLGLVGESGCGKSVTALAIAGLLPATATVSTERIVVAGENLATMAPRALCQVRGDTIGFVFQDPMTSLNPAFTVGNQLVEAIRLHLPFDRAAARDRARGLLDRVHIVDPVATMGRYPHELSGGMAQRVMIAMALACDPQLLIADEPTTALDVTVQGQIIDLLRDVQEESGMAILFITHDLGVVADVCDRAAVMYAGELVEAATVGTLFDVPRHPYTRGLLASRPTRDAKGGQLPTISGVVPPPGQWPAGCRFAPRCGHATDICETTQVLTPVGADGLVRCARTEALADDPMKVAQ